MCIFGRFSLFWPFLTTFSSLERKGHPFIVCHHCDRILHKKCKTTDNILMFRDKSYCNYCINNSDIVRYNPFYQPPHFNDEGIHDEEPTSYIESISTSSCILENCQSLSINQLNKVLPSESNNYFSACFLNIDGNYSNFDSFAVQTSSISHNFSVIGLAETNTDPANENLYPLNGYTPCYQKRFHCESTNQPKTKGSGVCLYVKNSLNFNVIKNLSLCKDSIESLFITVTNCGLEHLTVGVIYRSPNANISEFNEQYRKILSELQGKKAYILGDYNIDLLNLSSQHDQSFEQIIYDNGFIPTVSIVTHQMPNCKKTCIDNIYTNDIDPSTVSGVLVNQISHHKTIYLKKKLAQSITNQDINSSGSKITIHYNYSNANLDKLCEAIEHDLDWFEHNCPTFDSFLSEFRKKIDSTCKLTVPRTTKRNAISNPWITQGLINSIEKKSRLYFEWKDTCDKNTPGGCPELHDKYTKFNTFLKNLIGIAKDSHYANKFEEYRGNPKKTWEIINEIRGKSKVSTKDDFVVDGERVISRRIIANKYNAYFTSLANNLNQEVLSSDRFHVQPLKSFTQFMSKSVDSSIYLEETNTEEVSKIIQNLENRKASDIPIAVIKRPAHLILKTLSRLYNNCMHSGLFPSVFKTGKVIPIYKKDNKECIENYRPVSILPVFGKIFEKIIYNRLYKFFTSRGTVIAHSYLLLVCCSLIAQLISTVITTSCRLAGRLCCCVTVIMENVDIEGIDYMWNEVFSWTKEQLRRSGKPYGKLREIAEAKFLKPLQKPEIVDVCARSFEYINFLMETVETYRNACTRLQSQVIENQKTLINVQKELSECKSEKLEAMENVVKSSVATSVKEEFKSYSSVVSSSTPAAPTFCPEKFSSLLSFRLVLVDCDTAPNGLQTLPIQFDHHGIQFQFETTQSSR